MCSEQCSEHVDSVVTTGSCPVNVGALPLPTFPCNYHVGGGGMAQQQELGVVGSSNTMIMTTGLLSITLEPLGII